MTHTTRIETAEDLERIVDEQNTIIKGMSELVKGMDARIKLVIALLDSHHEILVKHGLAKPRGEDCLVN